jgi:hypothetical protein
MGSSSRSAAKDMLDNMSTAMTDAGALLDVIQLKLNEYGGHFSTMSAAIKAETQCDTFTDLGTSLQEISDQMALVKLPISSKDVDPMLKYLATSDTFPPDFGKVFGDDNEGILSFLFDGGLAMIALYVMLLAFFACFANYRSKCSDHGCGRCIKCIYIFLVLVFGSIFLLVNIMLGAGMMGTAVGLADMCAANPDKLVTGLFGDGGIMEDFDELEDMTYWINCAGTSPVSSKLSAIQTPLNALSNAALNGFWDNMEGVTGDGGKADDCYDATASIGAHVGTTPLSGGAPAYEGKACTTDSTDGTIKFDSAARQGTVLCKSRQTIEDFNQLFGCPAEGSVKGWTDYKTDATTPLKVPAGGLNSVYRSFVHGALCTDMVAVFFYLWLALSASSFFILFAFCVLPCTSRNGGAAKGGKDAEADDTKA